MISGIILDVDGVLIGEKIGFNFPEPHPDVINELKKIMKQGISISLCTAKPYFSIEKIIKSAKLYNTHITDGGAVIMDASSNIISNQLTYVGDYILKKHIIDKISAKNLLQKCLEKKIYAEFYTLENYFLDKSEICKISKQHEYILQRKAIILESLAEESLSFEITKILVAVNSEEDRNSFEKIFMQFKDKMALSWTIHPFTFPLKWGVITTQGVSKTYALMEISERDKIPFDKMLAVGDSLSDWQFIKLCKYSATMKNAGIELKKLVLSKGKDFSFIAPSVDKNGIIEVFKHYLPSQTQALK